MRISMLLALGPRPLSRNHPSEGGKGENQTSPTRALMLDANRLEEEWKYGYKARESYWQ